MTRIVRLAVPILLLTLAAGCRESESPENTPSPTGAPAAPLADKTSAAELKQHSDEIQKLLALPYAGDVEDDDEAEDGVVLCDIERTHPGYSLYMVHKHCTAVLIDAHGNVVKSWSSPGGLLWANSELLPNGDLIVPAIDPRSSDDEELYDELRYLLRFNWAGEIVWRRPLATHHDVELTPRGSFLTLTNEMRSVPLIHPTVPVRDERLTLLDDDGKVLRSLSFAELTSPGVEEFPLKRVRVRPAKGGLAERIVPFHSNSVEWAHYDHLKDRHPIYGPNAILVCFRNQDRIAVFDWERAAVLWAWGANELSGPHDAQYLENGNILVFDNGLRDRRSRIVELDPLKRTVVWQYQATPPSSFFTKTKGSCQRLPNGNTLIANADNGEAFEVTHAGEVVWRFICSHRDKQGRRATIVRIKRYERDFIEKLLAEHL